MSPNRKTPERPRRSCWLAVAGTRPEALKLAPVVIERRRRGGDVLVCSSGQHGALVERAWADFGLRADLHLGGAPAPPLGALTARVLGGLQPLLRRHAPTLVLVQGDTNTTLAAALAGFYARITVAHLEAGLRTHRRAAPFPEEQNRRLAGLLADYHFAATPAARRNLLAEGVGRGRIFVTGNTGIDALRLMRRRLARPGRRAHWARWLQGEAGLRPRQRLVLVTAHRRENFGPRLENVAEAVWRLARLHPECGFVWITHPNPRVHNALGALRRRMPGPANLTFLPPLDYEPFLYLLERATLVLTDSGGVQEEAAALGTPLLVLREATERPEALTQGGTSLVGTRADRIVAAARTALARRPRRVAAPGLKPLFGDGFAAARIVSRLEQIERGVRR